MPRFARSVAAPLAYLLSLTFAPSANADEELAKESKDAPPAAARKDGASYGWQTMVVDAAALGMMIGGARLDNRQAVGAGLAIYAAGPPVVHFAHGNVVNGLVSAGARVLLPPTGAALGFGIGFGVPYALSGGDEGGLVVGIVLGVTGLVLGGVGGYVGAVALDAAVLAREPAPERPQPPSLSLSPKLDLGRDRATIGVGGAF